ncbi:MAG TPA: TetR/AcrR family transcriptional regulator, partial [Acidimicrobiales bacterium]
MGTETPTPDRIVQAALVSFATKGYEATSLDAVAAALGIRKQTILYWFPSKEVLLEAVIDHAAAELSEALERTLSRAGEGWERVEAIVRSVFRLAARRPELLGMLREMGRLGPPASSRLSEALDPLLARATGFLEEEMAAGRMRRNDPRVVLLAAYS